MSDNIRAMDAMDRESDTAIRRHQASRDAEPTVTIDAP